MSEMTWSRLVNLDRINWSKPLLWRPRRSLINAQWFRTFRRLARIQPRADRRSGSRIFHCSNRLAILHKNRKRFRRGP